MEVGGGQVGELSPGLEGRVASPVHELVDTAAAGLKASRLLLSLSALASLGETLGDIVVTVCALDFTPQTHMSGSCGLAELFERFGKKKCFILSEADTGPLIDAGICEQVGHVAYWPGTTRGVTTLAAFSCCLRTFCWSASLLL